MSEEGSHTWVSHPKPLTKSQLRKLEKQFADTSAHLAKIRELEGESADDIDHPEWI